MQNRLDFSVGGDCGDCACDCGYGSSVLQDRWFCSPPARPVLYSLELTPSCNNRCPGCGNVFVEDRERVPKFWEPLLDKQWVSILRKVAPCAQRFKVTGGEPSLHPEFEQIIRMIDSFGVPFTLFTNGRWEQPDRILTLLQDCHYCAGALVSLHGAHPATHEAFTRVEGSFEETVANIERAARMGLRVHTNTVLTLHNHHEVESLVDLSRSLGAARAVFNRYIGPPMVELDLPLQILRDTVRKITSLGENVQSVGFGTCIPRCFEISSSTGCLAGIADCTIDPWGNVRACNHAPQVVGNLLEDSIERIWSSPSIEAWRELTPDECKGCDAFSTCHGGCRAHAVIRGRSADPLMTMPISTASQRMDLL